MRLSTLNKASRRLALNAAILTDCRCGCGLQLGSAALHQRRFQLRLQRQPAFDHAGPEHGSAALYAAGRFNPDSLGQAAAVFNAAACRPLVLQAHRRFRRFRHSPASGPCAGRKCGPLRNQQVASAEPIHAPKAAPLGASSGTLKTPDGREAKMPAQAASNGVAAQPQVKEKQVAAATTLATTAKNRHRAMAAHTLFRAATRCMRFRARQAAMLKRSSRRTT